MDRRLTTIGAALGLAAGAAGAAYYALFRRPLPRTSGAIRLIGLGHDVEIIRDSWGIPHIYATDLHDLLFAQGYVHAQDRLFQMEFWRRTGAGRLAEVVGPPAVEADRWMRVLGMRRVAEKEVALLDDETRELLLAYANGVNTFIDSAKLPIEFTLLRYRPERWQIADSLTWAKMMDWSLSVNWEGELLRAQLIDQLGPELMANLDGPYPEASPTTLSSDIDWSHIGSSALARAEDARTITGPPSEAGLGSNGWVVTGKRSSSGAPLLASDMHLALSVPSIWYVNHLSAQDYDVVGLTLAGIPGIVAGHNGRVAWTFTMGFADTQDTYIERLNPEDPHQYEFEGIWHDAQVLREEIVVKGAEPVVEEVVITRHGPLIDGLVPQEASEPLALRWTAHEPSDMIGLFWQLGRAHNCAELHEAMRNWTGPVLNAVYADVEGNIGYTLAGKIPVRAEGHDGRVPVPGWTGDHEWLGYVPFEHWPHAINPPEGMLVTANAKPVGDAYPYYLGNCWLPGFRAARITEFLHGAQGLNVADFCAMQFDQVSVLARRVGQQLSNIALVPPYATPNTQSALRLFQDWDGHLAADSPTAAIYQVFIRRLLYNLFGTVAGDLSDAPDLDDRFVGKGPHPVLAAASPIFGPNGRALVSHLLDTPDSPLFRQRSRDDLMLQSLREAVEFLEWKLGMQVEEWRWGDLHQLTYIHPLGQAKPLDKLFNRGPYPIGGDDTTIWNTVIFFHSVDNGQMTGPACRFVVDLDDLNRSRLLNAPGQSGQPGSRHYADRIEAWFEGDYHPMLFRRQDVVAQAEATLHLLA